jgi:1,4-alpha-glucan branching enzyme
MLFMGQEYLEDGFFSDDDPLDWDKLALFPGIHAMYRDMIGLRRNLGGNTRGLQGNNTNVHHVDDGNKVIAFHRWDQGGAGDDVMVIANFKNQAWSSYRIGLPGPGLWQVRLNSDWVGYDPSFGNHQSPDVLAEQIPYDGMPYSAPFSFGPYSALILSQ